MNFSARPLDFAHLSSLSTDTSLQIFTASSAVYRLQSEARLWCMPAGEGWLPEETPMMMNQSILDAPSGILRIQHHFLFFFFFF